MSDIVATFNSLLATGGIFVFLAATVLVVDMYSSRSLAPLVRGYGLLLAFVLTVAGSALTLVYSEMFGFVPCGLCWMQRVFLYPQVFILALAVWYKQHFAAGYGLLLSVLGLSIAAYQHYLQMGGRELVTCPTSGGDCATRFLFEYGFVTFPLLSVMLFFFLICLYVYILKEYKDTQKRVQRTTS